VVWLWENQTSDYLKINTVVVVYVRLMIGLPILFENIIFEQTALTNSDTTPSQRIKFGFGLILYSIGQL
jgi:hypothetical protein